MKTTNHKTKSVAPVGSSAVLGITVSAIDFPMTIKSLAPTTLAHIVKGLKRKKRIKRIYIPLRGIPNGPESLDVTGNHFSAIFGPGSVQTFETEAPVLEDGALDKSSVHQVVENLNRCLLIEANVFIHKRVVMPNDPKLSHGCGKSSRGSQQPTNKQNENNQS